MSDTNEAIVAQANDLQDGDMKQVKVGDTDVLLARVRGQYFATGAMCTHYGAPLVEGALSGTRVICPWHHACFNVTTGDLEEPCALDALPHYDVRRRGDDILVTVPTEATDRRELPPVAKTAQDGRVFVILGGGAAGEAALEELRREGFAGRIMLITREQRLPYDRINLSKDYLDGNAGEDALPLRPDAFYQEHAIELLREHDVQQVDAQGRVITFADGSTLRYDALLLASGSKPRTLSVPGSDLKNVFTLRSVEDADNIIAATKAITRAVVVGSSFIGMEAAASLTRRKVAVTVVAPDAVPFARTLGERIGKVFQGMHEEMGVTFRLPGKVVRIEGTDRVEAVILESGERIATDAVVVGVGVQPSVEYLRGIELQKDGSIAVDATLKVADSLFAAGDIATFPYKHTGENIRVEHWRVAEQHGRAAAHSMLGQNQPYEGVPFFWTAHFGQALHYSGSTKVWDDIIFWGDPEERGKPSSEGSPSTHKFIAFFVKNNKVVAVAGMNSDTETAAIEELMRTEKLPTPDGLRERVDVVTLLKRG